MIFKLKYYDVMYGLNIRERRITEIKAVDGKNFTEIILTSPDYNIATAVDFDYGDEFHIICKDSKVAEKICDELLYKNIFILDATDVNSESEYFWWPVSNSKILNSLISNMITNMPHKYLDGTSGHLEEDTSFEKLRLLICDLNEKIQKKLEQNKWRKEHNLGEAQQDGIDRVVNFYIKRFNDGDE